MKSLSQEEIRRMFNGGTGGSGGGGVLDPSALAGLASQGWVEGNYVSKSFFNSLFTIHTKTTTTVTDENGDPVGTPTVVTGTIEPNEIVGTTSTTDESTGYTTTVTKEITSIEAKHGLCTDFFLSALGLNSSGGGGGISLNEPLLSINNAGLSNHPSSSGQTIIWNGSAWAYGTTGSGTVTSISMTVPTGLSVSPSTITSSGTFAISFATGYGIPLTADVTKGVTAYGWGDHSQVGYWKDGTGNHPTTLTGYGIIDAYTKTEADATFMTIAAFENLFNAMNSSGQKVSHPYSSAVASIKAMVGLYTDQFLSALGLNSSGGGGGISLNEPLLSINNAGLSNHPSSSGQTIIWNGSAWAYGTTGSGTVTSVAMSVPQGFNVSGSPITTSGTFAITFSSGYALPTTADVNKGVTAYGWGDHSQVGYWKDGTGNHPTTLTDYGITDAYTKTEADATFMTIAAFENLFNAIGSDGSTKINHPYASGVSSIKAMVGLWTNQYLSALGLNDSGGGGGATLNEPLASINTALLGMPTQTGQVITWNGSQWIYTIPSGGGGGGTGTVTSITAGTGLSGGTITTMGTIAISTTYQGYISEGHTAYGWGNHAAAGYLTGITAAMINAALGFTLSGTAGATYNLTTISTNASHGETAFSWGNHADAGYLTGITATMINSALGFKISGTSGRTYNLNTISNNAEDGETAFGWGDHSLQGYLTGITSPMVTTALGYTPVPNSTTWWGQSIVNGTVTGNLSSVESITMSESIVGLKSLEFNTSGELQGYGGFLDFHYNGSLADFTSRIIEETSGVLSIQAGSIVNNEFVGTAAALVVGIGYNGSSITIGNGKLVWDETNNSLKVIRSNGSAANIYATGGVSSLGMQAGVSALDAMTFNYVTINNNLEFGAASRITHAVTNDDRYLYIGRSDNAGWVGLADMCSQAGPEKWYIYAATGEASFMTSVRSAKFYLDGSRYLYLDSSNNLMFYNGTTPKQVAFVN